MSQVARSGVTVADVLKALSDPIRWEIVRQMGEVDELPCAVLEDTLPISKPTISYHTKILAHAGIIDVHKRGRSLFYELNRDVLQATVDELWSLAPAPRTVRDGRIDGETSGTGRRRTHPKNHASERSEAAIPTW